MDSPLDPSAGPVGDGDNSEPAAASAAAADAEPPLPSADVLGGDDDMPPLPPLPGQALLELRPGAPISAVAAPWRAATSNHKEGGTATCAGLTIGSGTRQTTPAVLLPVVMMREEDQRTRLSRPGAQQMAAPYPPNPPNLAGPTPIPPDRGAASPAATSNLRANDATACASGITARWAWPIRELTVP